MYRAWYGLRAAARLTSHLPIRNGYTPAGQLSGRPRRLHIPIIFASAFGTALSRNN